ncbi:MAG: hypothetical protein WCL06_07215 [Bacteroidota bacterium]
MGFVGEVLRNAGIQWYYIVGLFIFLTLFIVIVYRTIKIPKSVLKQNKESILENDEPTELN